MVIAPHPDDESLATGGLVQAALASGARVTVVMLTDGDNNPWPQRAAERRIWIGAGDRERWGVQRRQEARAALSILGVPDASIRCLGFPDLGLTELVSADADAAIAGVCEIFRDTNPTVVAVPSLSDRHPDHSAAHVMCCLALAKCDLRPRLLSYMVHGAASALDREFELGANACEQKMRAVAAHRTQLMLSRTRIMAYAERPECFAIDFGAAAGMKLPANARLPWRISRLSASLASLILVTNDRAWRIAIQADDAAARNEESPRCVRDADGWLWLRIPEHISATSPAFAKLAGRIASPWIYDRWGWTRLGA